jgi:hypothetical protein
MFVKIVIKATPLETVFFIIKKTPAKVQGTQTGVD